jgi:hypothetical protein
MKFAAKGHRALEPKELIEMVDELLYSTSEAIDGTPPVVSVDVFGLDPEDPTKASTVEGTIREVRIEDREHVGDGKEDPERETRPTIVLEVYQEKTFPKEEDSET